MPDLFNLEQPKLLIVEGNHERDFFTAWMKHLGKTDVQVMPIGGKTILASRLTALCKQEGFDTVVTLVIVRDADDNPAAAFRS